MKITFVRHGESVANLLNKFSNRGLRHGLTERGRTQATALARQLGNLPVSRILSSPLLRAVQTAEILARDLNVPYASPMLCVSTIVVPSKGNPTRRVGPSIDEFWKSG
jgi:broad specificity phosphatase PhoE